MVLFASSMSAIASFQNGQPGAMADFYDSDQSIYQDPVYCKQVHGQQQCSQQGFTQQILNQEDYAQQNPQHYYNPQQYGGQSYHQEYQEPYYGQDAYSQQNIQQDRLVVHIGPEEHWVVRIGTGDYNLQSSYQPPRKRYSFSIMPRPRSGSSFCVGERYSFCAGLKPAYSFRIGF